MQHTRQQIIRYLHLNRIATSTDLARALLVTPANVRHHLRLLQDENLIEVVGLEPASSRGRPTKIFGLKNNAMMHNLDGLSAALLNSFFHCKLSTEKIVNLIANNLFGYYPSASSMHTQLKKMVERLNQLNYQASWEASPSGPRIIFRNCPYAMIISEHPEICAIDTAILTNVLNQSVIQSAKLERNPDGSPYCAFIPQNSEL